MIGKTLNHFKITGALGKGGMGEVYLAEDTRLKRKVALKILPPEMAADRERLERFQREAEAIAALNHPNVVTIYSVEEADGIHFLTMEFVEGNTLADMIPATGMDVALLCSVAIAAGEALSAAHDKGVIHRDFKPANVMVSRNGVVKILDFGLAKLNRIGNENASVLMTDAQTQAGVVMGTAPYMSPEQAVGQTVDARSDIFSFGIALYQLASGRLPFGSGSMVKILADIVHAPPPPLEETIPDSLKQIIGKCLEKNPDDRYANMRQVVAGLRSVNKETTAATPLPAASKRASQHNLPAHVTSFIGREHELVEVAELLQAHRLVTFIGAGGTGKTRLALEAAQRTIPNFDDGVWQVSLAFISSPDLVGPAIAEAVSAIGRNDKPVIESLTEAVRERNMLLVIDSCEHVLSEASRVIDLLLRAAPRLRILTTSREALNVSGECVWTVPPLSIPGRLANITVDSALQSDAVRLFVDRARSRDPRFTLTQSNVDAVAAICARLDGIPLAIELAAARIKVMSASEIGKRLNDCFKLLTAGARESLPRHQTLRAAVDWSYDLLSPEEQLLFGRLSCFPGGFDLDALESICAWGDLHNDDSVDLLARLVDKSLVLSDRVADDLVRYRLLEPLRQYAQEKLAASGEHDTIARRHFSYFADLADRAYEERAQNATFWLDRLEMDHDNLRAALEWSKQGDPANELRLAGALAWFWVLHSHLSEGRARLSRVLQNDHPRNHELARGLCGASSLASYRDEYQEGREPAEEGLAIWRELGNRREIAMALESIGWRRFASNKTKEALEAFEESLRLLEALNDQRLINRASIGICQVLISNGDVAAAEPLAQKCLQFAQEQDEPNEIHYAYHFLADCALIRGDVVAARSKYADSLRAAIRVGDRLEITFEMEGIAMALAGMKCDAKAMRLEGAVQAEHHQLQSVVEIEFWMILKQRYLDAAEKRLGPETAEREKQAGRSMSLDAAIEYALDTASD